jgi:hypothetical protein
MKDVCLYINIDKYILKVNESDPITPPKIYPGESPKPVNDFLYGMPPVKEEIIRPITEVMGDERKEMLNAKKHNNNNPH